MMAAARPDLPHAIITSELSKHYGSIAALDRVSLSVPTGSTYGFLGPNGAGKTTTIKVLLGFVKASSGSAMLLGHNVWRDGVRARRDLGFLVQPDNLYPDMSGEAHLTYAARLSGRETPLRMRLLEALELSQVDLRRRLGSYSKGMRQKLALVAAIQHDPAVLILDEPTDGLDPLIHRNFEDVLDELHHRGRTIFMSSHDLAEIERICAYVAVIRGGRLVAEETVANLKQFRRRRASIVFQDDPPVDVDHIPGTTVLERDGRRFILLVGDDVNPLMRVIAEAGVDEFTLSEPNLDDIFMEFYGQTMVPR